MNVPDRPTGWTRTAVDVGLGLVFAVAQVFTAVAIATSWGGSYWQFDAVAGLLVFVIATLRRRHPVRMALLGAGIAVVSIFVAWVAGLPHEPGPAMTLALAILVGSAVRTAPGRSAGGVVAAGVGVVIASWATDASWTDVAPTIPVLSGIALLLALTTGLFLRLLDARRRSMADQVRRDERLALARELHDVVAHHVTGIVVQAQAAQIVARRDPERLDDSLADISAAGSDALAAMRRVVGLLRDTEDAAPSTSGPEGLGELVARFNEHGPPVELRLPDRDTEWPPEVTSTVYRIVQEALTNISRHAPQTGSVTVTIAEHGGAVTVEVLDDAMSGPVRQSGRTGRAGRAGRTGGTGGTGGTGFGLVGMRERVEALGGSLTAGPRPRAERVRAGWSVLATLPVHAEETR